MQADGLDGHQVIVQEDILSLIDGTGAAASQLSENTITLLEQGMVGHILREGNRHFE
jgi:hypothetical protein